MDMNMHRTVFRFHKWNYLIMITNNFIRVANRTKTHSKRNLIRLKKISPIKGFVISLPQCFYSHDWQILLNVESTVKRYFFTKSYLVIICFMYRMLYRTSLILCNSIFLNSRQVYLGLYVMPTQQTKGILP